MDPKRKWLIVVILLSAVLAAGLAGGSIFLSSSAFKNLLTDKINQQIAGGITVASLDIRLLPGTVALGGVRLQDARGEVLATAATVRVRFFWLPLIHKSLHLAELRIEKADVNAMVDRQDRLNLARALAPSEGGRDHPEDKKRPSGWTVTVDGIDIQADRVKILRPARDMDIQAQAVELRGGVDLAAPRGHLKATLGRTDWRMASRSGSVGRVEVDAAYNPGLSKPLVLGLEAPGSNLRLSAVPAWDNLAGALDADLSWHLDLAGVHQWLGPLVAAVPETAGILEGKASVRGSLGDPQVDLRLDGRQLSVAGIDFQRVAAHLGVQQRRMTVEQAESHSPWGHLSLAGVIDLRAVLPLGLDRPAAGLEGLAYDLTVKADGIRPQLVPRAGLPFAGILQGRLAVAGKGLWDRAASGTGQIHIQGDLSPVAAGTPAAGPLKVALEAAIQRHGQRLEVTRTRADLGSTVLQGNGMIDLTTQALQAAGRLQFDNLAEVAAFTGIELPHAAGQIDFRCSGGLRRPQVEGSVLARELTYGRWRFGQVYAKAAWDEKRVLHISDLMLENQGTVIKGQGQFTLYNAEGGILADPAVEGGLTFSHLVLSRFGLTSPAREDLNGRLQATGSIKALQAELTLDRSPLAWQGIRMEATGSARWRQGRLEISPLQLSQGASRIDVSGSLTWRDPKSGTWRAVPVVDLGVESQRLELSDIHPPYRGRVTFKAAAKGPADDPLGRFQMHVQDLVGHGQKIDALDTHGRFAGRTIHVDRLVVVVAAQERITGDGWYAFDGHFGVNLVAEALHLDHIAVLQQQYPVNGTLSATLKGEGTLERPNIVATLKVSDPRFDQQAFDDFHARLNLVGRELTLDGNFNFRVQAHARLDRGTYEITAAFDHTDLSPYLAVAVGSAWSGRLSGSLQAEGNWHALEQTTGRVDLGHVEVTYAGRPLVSTDKLAMTIRDNVLNMPSTRLTLLQDGFLEIGGHGPLSRDVQLRLDGRLPLATMAPFTDVLSDLTGTVALHATAQGPLSSLRWQAELRPEDAGFVVPDLLQGVEKINGTIRLSPENLEVEDLTGSMDTGRLAVEGNIRLDGWVPSEGRLNVNLHALPLRWPDTMEAVISGDLALQGGPSNATLSGELVLVEGLYYKDVRLHLLSAVTQVNREQPVRIHRPRPEWMHHIQLDLKLSHRNPFLVDNNLARLEVVPDLHLGGTAANPVMSGRASVTQGELMYGRKTFTVKRGVVDFVNPNRIEPTLDIAGEVHFRKWVITLGVSGTPDQLSLSLSSDPPASDSDILSLLLLGRTNAEMLQGEGSGGQTTRQMLAQLVASTWGEDIKRSTGVDIFEVGTGSEEDANNPNSIQLTVGKRLSRRLTVKYDVESQEAGYIQRAVSEYQFVDHVLASGFQDSEGKYGGELLFRMEFR